MGWQRLDVSLPLPARPSLLRIERFARPTKCVSIEFRAEAEEIDILRDHIVEHTVALDHLFELSAVVLVHRVQSNQQKLVVTDLCAE